MSEAQEADRYERTPEEKLRSLIRRDIDPEITQTAKNALHQLQEESS